ncbi:hypothetical protein WA026_005522 [Henosepilachna vigintioctopunctata]|uniref:Spaetzle domain-containing protein n=1 Tax=Henosepilachna vigintioctopunctata TaxID=420089 RepID=A0AAW1U264_9CUCU
MINMKIFVIFVHCFMLVRYVHSSVRIYNAVTGSAYYEENNYIYNDYYNYYDYDAEDDPEQDTQRVSLEKYREMIRASENVPDYPADKIRDALKKKGELKKLFETSGSHVYVGASESNSKTACEVVHEYSYPLTMYDVNGNKRFLLNLDEYRQIVRHGYCNESTKCKLPGGESFRYKTTCKQNHMNVALLTFENDDIKPHNFSIDCGCSCEMIKKF